MRNGRFDTSLNTYQSSAHSTPKSNNPSPLHLATSPLVFSSPLNVTPPSIIPNLSSTEEETSSLLQSPENSILLQKPLKLNGLTEDTTPTENNISSAGLFFHHFDYFMA